MASESPHRVSSAQNSDDIAQFVYSPLKDPMNLRLFYVLPGTGEEPLVLEIFESERQGSDIDESDSDIPHVESSEDGSHWDRGDYIALSYVWGDARDRIAVRLNDCQFSITRNLHGFLDALRDPHEQMGPFWADAICINQRDNVEKGTQVSMMDKIYMIANQCVVWLGQESDITADAFEIFHSLAARARQLCQENPSHIPDPGSDPSLNHLRTQDTYVGLTHLAILRSPKLQEELHNELLSSTAHLDSITPAEQSLRAWQLCMDIFLRPWFTRMWTLQEFVCPDTVYILCGQLSIDSESLSIASVAYNTFSLATTALQVPLLTLDPEDQKLFKFFYDICLARGMYQTSAIERQSHILDQVIKHRGREATVAQDRIYALLGVARETIFTPDYAKPVEEVYTSFAAWCILDGRIQAILENASGIVESCGIPTWVPDWTVVEQRPPQLSSLAGNPYGGAGGSAQEPPRFSDNLKSLYVDGIKIGRIEAVFESATWGIEKVRSMRKTLSEKHSFRDPQAAGQSLEEAILRTLRADIAMFTPGVPAQYERIGAISVPHDTLGSYPENYDFLYTANGCLGLTRRGKGKKGDSVAVIRGVGLPILLRQRDSHFELVDACSYGKSLPLKSPVPSEIFCSPWRHGWRDLG